MIPLLPEDKIEPTIWNDKSIKYIDSKRKILKAKVFFEEPVKLENIHAFVGGQEDSIIANGSDGKIWNLIISRNALINLAKNDIVNEIMEWHEKAVTMNYARKLTKVDDLQVLRPAFNTHLNSAIIS